jgi:hypothetical protein
MKLVTGFVLLSCRYQCRRVLPGNAATVMHRREI